MEYITDPRLIEETSMKIILEHLPELEKLPVGEKKIIMRVVHTTGDPAIAEFVRFSKDAVEKGISAIRNGARLFTDVQMLLSGVNGAKLAEFGMKARCDIRAPEVIKEANRTGLTRAMVAMALAAPEMDGSIIAIGNAPTALFEVCKRIKAGEINPALVIGTPVGFVGAKESKEALLETDVPHITVLGTRGGSNVAASIMNALLYMS